MAEQAPSGVTEEDLHRVIERPDGFYWRAEAGGKEYGPFPTLLAAVQDMLVTAANEELEEGESVKEAEVDIGIMDWIDPDTGQPAEETTPRLTDE